MEHFDFYKSIETKIQSRRYQLAEQAKPILHEMIKLGMQDIQKIYQYEFYEEGEFERGFRGVSFIWDNISLNMIKNFYNNHEEK